MVKSLKAWGSFAIMLYIMACVFMPFANPWFFLLSIPMIAMMPHMDRIINYLSSWME